MAPSREIEKLQRRWQENPLGLTFAPLAEAYRKEGMHADALELLNQGLAQHPNYVPAHIVRGRCFLDTRADAAAQQSFLRVADLDPENVIALKGLADIAERAGRYPEAIARLERLLEFDRNNDEARSQLDRLLIATAMPSPGQVTLPAEPARIELGLAEVAAPVRLEPAVPPPPVEPPAPIAAVVVEPAAPLETVALPPLAPVATNASVDATPVSVEAPEAVVTPSAAGAAGAPSAPAEVESVGPSADVADESVVVPRSVADANQASEAPRASIVDLASEELEVVMYDPVELSSVGGSEFQMPADADDLRPSAARGAADLDLDEAGPPADAGVSVGSTESAPIEPVAATDQAPLEAAVSGASAAAVAFDGAEMAVGPEAIAATDPSLETAAAAPADAFETAADAVGSVDAPTEPASATADEFDFADEAGDPAVDDAEAVAGVEPEPELVVTETMAEIFLRQGHRQLALAVYTQLVSREPDNVRIREAIGRLEGEFRAPQAGLPTYAAVLTGGQSVRGFFERLLAS
ncbi:MAG: tetratricopeptide repeat protein, partial [Gemmatimonadales bacterium]|nr:tetratricopeptide repeat protein [Gemmatimonadales bacterium]